MMKRKLTLTIDERVVKTAKAYPSRADKSVSELVEASLDGIDYDFPIEKGFRPSLEKLQEQ